jgi:hypothetical protein
MVFMGALFFATEYGKVIIEYASIAAPSKPFTFLRIVYVLDTARMAGIYQCLNYPRKPEDKLFTNLASGRKE